MIDVSFVEERKHLVALKSIYAARLLAVSVRIEELDKVIGNG